MDEIKTTVKTELCGGCLEYGNGCNGCTGGCADCPEAEKAAQAAAVHHSQHYNVSPEFECIKVIRAWFGAEKYKGFLLGNICKYICRYENKNGAEDLRKAREYLDMLI